MNKGYYNSQLKKGTDIEMEHTKIRKVARGIAKDHLKENIDYYKYVDNKGKEFLVSDNVVFLK